MLRPHLGIVVLSLLLGACAWAPQLPREIGTSTFVIERDLEGSTVARGKFSAINVVRRSFTAYLEGVRSGETFTLTEHFEFDDGEKDHKTWVLRLEGEGRYAGTREDVVGEARGWQDGSAFRLEYLVRLPADDGEPGMKVRFRDVMVKTADGVVLNHASIGKWGLRVGTVELVIRPAP